MRIVLYVFGLSVQSVRTLVSNSVRSAPASRTWVRAKLRIKKQEWMARQEEKMAAERQGQWTTRVVGLYSH